MRSAGGREGLVFELNLASGTFPRLRAGGHVYVQQRRTSGWSPPILLSPGSGRHLAPVAVENSIGGWLVFWWHLNGEQSTIQFCRLGGSEHDPIPGELLVGGDCRNVYPAACADAAGQVWLAWQAEQSGVTPSIFVARRSRIPKDPLMR